MIDDWACSDTVFRIPPSHHHCTLDNFDWPSERVRDAVDWFLEGVREQTAPHLILVGDQGNGKSHLSVALYRNAVLRYGTQDCWWGDVPEFSRKVKDGFDTGRSKDLLQDALEATSFVALDDVWARPLTPWELDNILFGLINSAVMNKAALVLTTNYTKDQIAGALAPHEQDRLLQNSRIITLRGRSRRLHGQY